MSRLPLICRSRLVEIPQTAVVLGSGLGRLAREAEDAVRIPYTDIPGFPQSTVASHAGILTAGRLNGAPGADYVRPFSLL